MHSKDVSDEGYAIKWLIVWRAYDYMLKYTIKLENLVVYPVFELRLQGNLRNGGIFFHVWYLLGGWRFWTNNVKMDIGYIVNFLSSSRRRGGIVILASCMKIWCNIQVLIYQLLSKTLLNLRIIEYELHRMKIRIVCLLLSLFIYYFFMNIIFILYVYIILLICT